MNVMKMEPVSISIVIPAYNIAEYIKECLESVKAQTLKSIEIIVVNDGSTDQTHAIVQEFIERHSFVRMKLISQPNQGLSAARNTGVFHATGDYLYFLDGDDWIDGQMLEVMYKKATESNADVVICDYKKKFTGKEEIISGGLIPEMVPGNKDEILKLFLTGKIVIAAWNKIFRRSFYEKNKFQFPVGYIFEDIPLTILISQANKIIKVDQPFYNYRQREGSIMKTLSTKVLKKLDLVQEIQMYLKEENLSTKLYLEFQWFYNELIVLQLINDTLKNRRQNQQLCNQIIDRILSFECTGTYFKNIWQNPYFNIKYKTGLTLLKYFPNMYKRIYQLSAG